MQLADCYDSVAPCFPPAHNAFDMIFAKYHEQLAAMVDDVGAAAAALSSNDILQVCSCPLPRCFPTSSCSWVTRQQLATSTRAHQSPGTGALCCMSTRSGVASCRQPATGASFAPLQMTAWISDFQSNARELGVADEQSAFSTAAGSGTALLVAEYGSRTYDLLHDWSVNILQV